RCALGCRSEAAVAVEVLGVGLVPLAGGGAAVAGTVGFTGALDPEPGVHRGVARVGRGLGAQSAGSGIAPLPVGVAEPVAAGVDDEGLAAHLARDLLAVGGVVLGGVEVGDVQGEARSLCNPRR